MLCNAIKLQLDNNSPEITIEELTDLSYFLHAASCPVPEINRSTTDNNHIGSFSVHVLPPVAIVRQEEIALNSNAHPEWWAMFTHLLYSNPHCCYSLYINSFECHHQPRSCLLTNHHLIELIQEQKYYQPFPFLVCFTRYTRHHRVSYFFTPSPSLAAWQFSALVVV